MLYQGRKRNNQSYPIFNPSAYIVATILKSIEHGGTPDSRVWQNDRQSDRQEGPAILHEGEKKNILLTREHQDDVFYTLEKCAVAMQSSGNGIDRVSLFVTFFGLEPQQDVQSQWAFTEMLYARLMGYGSTQTRGGVGTVSTSGLASGLHMQALAQKFDVSKLLQVHATYIMCIGEHLWGFRWSNIARKSGAKFNSCCQGVVTDQRIP